MLSNFSLQMIKRITNIVDKFQDKLTGYKTKEVDFNGVKINNVKVDKLVTRFDYFDVDITNGITMLNDKLMCRRNNRIDNDDSSSSSDSDSNSSSRSSSSSSSSDSTSSSSSSSDSDSNESMDYNRHGNKFINKNRDIVYGKNGQRLDINRMDKNFNRDRFNVDKNFNRNRFNKNSRFNNIDSDSSSSSDSNDSNDSGIRGHNNFKNGRGMNKNLNRDNRMNYRDNGKNFNKFRTSKQVDYFNRIGKDISKSTLVKRFTC